MPERLSPAFPCICGERDWSYDPTKVRWVCNRCMITGRPTPEPPRYDEVFDFNTWHDSVMDDWQTINSAWTNFEQEPKPQSSRDGLIQLARRRKLEAESSRVAQLSTIAVALKSIREENVHGDMYVRIPTRDLEIRMKW